jgi:cytochrome c oxidase cbb3-type subunit 3
VRNIEDIAKVISEGAANGSMPAWKNRLHVNVRVLTAAYIASLRKNPIDNPKKPAEGNVIPPWSE